MSDFFSKTWSDTFRSVLVYGKGQESRQKIFHNREKKKKFIFLRSFDRRNKLFCVSRNLIRKGCF